MPDLCEALAEGVKLEHDSRVFYSRNARAAKNDEIRSLFGMLAREEKEHGQVLLRLSEGKACRLEKPGKTKTRAAKARTAKLPKIGDSFSSEELEEYSTVLLAAMSFEQEMKGFYEALALAAGDEGDKKTFRELAEFEQKHYELLDALYEQVNYYRLQT